MPKLKPVDTPWIRIESGTTWSVEETPLIHLDCLCGSKLWATVPGETLCVFCYRVYKFDMAVFMNSLRWDEDAQDWVSAEEEA